MVGCPPPARSAAAGLLCRWPCSPGTSCVRQRLPPRSRPPALPPACLQVPAECYPGAAGPGPGQPGGRHVPVVRFWVQTAAAVQHLAAVRGRVEGREGAQRASPGAFACRPGAMSRDPCAGLSFRARLPPAASPTRPPPLPFLLPVPAATPPPVHSPAPPSTTPWGESDSPSDGLGQSIKRLCVAAAAAAAVVCQLINAPPVG